MNKEKVNSLKSEMRKVMNDFNLKFKSKCKCGYEQEVDYFDYYANPFVLCLNCEKRATYSNAVSFEEIPFYKRKFIDGHFKVVTELTTSGIDFSQDIKEEQEGFFDYNWDFAGGFTDIYTSFEMFLYQLTFKQVEELVDRGKKIEINYSKFKDCPKEVFKIIELINSNEKMEINLMLEGISNNFRVKDCTLLLKSIGRKDIKNFDPCFDLQKERNHIVHRGEMADFEDYANAFIIIGNLLNIYKIEK